MAAMSHVSVNDEMPVEIPPIPQSHGIEAFKDIVFGSIAGITGKYIEYPFDTVKVRLQSQPDTLPLRYNGPLDCFRQSIRADGFRGLYRGISAPLFGAAVENSSLFFSYRISQRLLQSMVYSSAEPLPFSGLLISGAISGAFTSLLLTPIELVKCKMQVPVSAAGYKPGPLTIIASVFRHHGVLGFWHGQMGTLIRETGGSAAWFGSYEAVSAFFRKYSPTASSAIPHGTDKPLLPLHQQMLAGAAAGVGYNFFFYPADTIKSRMQTEDVALSGGNRSFWTVGKALWQQQGLKGLYRGCGITVGRAAPSSAFIFSVYEGLRFYVTITMTLSAEELKLLSTKAIAAKAAAYCPYSNFRVGACVLTEQQEFISGANVENASYPVGTCAERVALGMAVFAGHKQFKAIAVATDSKHPTSPCGMCRQFIREFTGPDFPIYMYDADGNHTVKTIGDLLPDSFGPGDLGK
ncbi:Mitochondrial carrier domain containing protein [Elaphomyces granulatus]